MISLTDSSNAARNLVALANAADLGAKIAISLTKTADVSSTLEGAPVDKSMMAGLILKSLTSKLCASSRGETL